jgi:hypothetical protein
VDVTAGPITGDFQNLSDNYFKLTNFTGGPGTLTVNSLGEDVGAPTLQIQTSAGIFNTFVLGDGDEEVLILPSGDLYFFFDWQTIFGQDTGFDVSFTPLTIDEPLGAAAAGTPVTSTPNTLAPGGTRTYTLDVPADIALEFSQTNDEGSSVNISISGPNGELISQSANNGTSYYVTNGQPSTLLIEVENTSTTADRTNTTLTFNVIAPYDMGSLAAGDATTYTEAANVASKDRRFAKVVVTEDVLLSGVLVGDPATRDPDLRVYVPGNSTRLHNYGTGQGEEFDLVAYQPGTYIFEIFAFNELDNGFTLSLTAFSPPTLEVEPNNMVADATPLTGIPVLSEGTSARDGMDTDIFSFTVATAGAYNISLGTTGADGCAVLSLHNAAGDIIEQDSANAALSVSAYLQANTYLFSVSGNCQGDAATFDYEAAISNLTPQADGFDVEPNNDSASAVAITGDPTATLALGTITSPTDEDWYMFTLAADATLAAAPGPFGPGPNPHPGITFEFFDATGTTSLGVGSASLTAGDFFVKVSGFNGTDFIGNSYGLSFIETPADYYDLPSLAIPDNNAAGATTTLNVPDMCVIADMEVVIDITHTYKGDVLLDLTAPDGVTIVRLHNGTGGSTDDIKETYGANATAPAESLTAFNGIQAMGDWTLRVEDTAGGDTGTVNVWGLNFTCAP